jgi:3-hydroxymyristoyl/3-hydroxydecanoyl-(acyl carrier protein) dehydratase
MLMVQCSTDAEEEEWNIIIQQNLPAFTEKHRLLVYGTNTGKVAFIRQIIPQLHIDYETEVIKTVKPHIGKIIQYAVSGQILVEKVDMIDSFEKILA